MKPLRLEIEGLESYSEKQVIDFERLCRGGLFGIFGETGSGKSTILDAMILALYGDIPRSSELDDKKKLIHFLNTSSNKMEVYYKFALGEDIYEVERKYYLGKEKGEVKLKTRDPLLKKNGKLIAEQSKKVDTQISEEFGLSMEDFIRTVVLPQGKFSDFVKLKNKPKREMLENIFGLEKYGEQLKKKIKEERDKWLKKEEENREEIEALGDISQEKLDEIEKDRMELSQEIENNEKEKKQLEESFTELSKVRELSLKKEELLEKKNKFENVKVEFELKRQKLERSEKVDEIGKYRIAMKDAEKNKAIKENELKECSETQRDIEEKKLFLERKILELEQQIDKKERFKSELDYNRDEEEKINEIITIKTILNGNRESLSQILERIEEKKEELKSKEGELLLKEKKFKDIEKEFQSLPNIDEGDRDEQVENLNKLTEVLNRYGETSKKKILEIEGLNKLKSQLLKIEQLEQELDLELKDLEREKKENLAFELAKGLKEGEPCPVCGAIHHPNIIKIHEKNLEEVDGKIKNTQKEKENIISKKGEILGKINKSEENISNLVIYFNDKIIDENIYKILAERKENLEKDIFTRKEKNELLREKKEKLKNQIFIFNEKIESLKKEIEKIRENIIKDEKEKENLTLNIDKFEKDIEKLGEKYLKIELSILKDRKSELKNNYEILTQVDLDIRDLKSKLESLRKEINIKIDKSYRGKLQIVELNSDIHNLEKNIEENKIKSEELMSKYGFLDIQDVRKSYLSPEKQGNIKREIEEYNSQCQKLKVNLEEVVHELAGREFSQEELENIVQLKDEKDNKIKELIRNLGELNERIKQCSQNLNKYKDSENRLKEIRKALRVAEDLYSNFNKGEFIKFLATKKMRGIIENASIRLNKISNGRYSLYSDEECDFYVIDVFNGGIKRRVGTLSGGETFVVSLCLALALSKQLQLKGKIPLEFFFLDEGFGSLDTKLLDKVMDSIESIRKEENISIGIITHVEDLKVRIENRLNIEKAIPGIKGSRIRIE